MRNPILTFCSCLAALLLQAMAASAGGVRIKDVTDFEGARSNQLYGLGLVVGLEGTGSRSLFTQQVAADMLQKLNVGAKIFQDLPSDNVIRSGNVSVVMVTAEIGPFARKGSRLNVMISALDDAKSLQGGVLIMTPLRGADGETYAVAQGALTVGGFLISGQAASVQKNHTTTGQLIGGAMVEREALGKILHNGCLRLLLRQPDFGTAQTVAQAIEARFPYMAMTVDAGTVQVMVPKNRERNVVGFAGEIGSLEVVPDVPARVVVNERTGTIVSGAAVKVSAAAIAHGSLTIVKTEETQVSQPGPLSPGRTVTTPTTDIKVKEPPGPVREFGPTITVGDLAKALNALGATPRDLISIFQALERAGALHAELVIL